MTYPTPYPTPSPPAPRLAPLLTLLAAALVALPGCRFLTGTPPEEPDPLTDGVLRCGETEDVSGLRSGDSIDVEVGVDVGVTIRTDFASPGDSARLRIEDSSSLERALEIWDAVTGDRIIPGFRGAGDRLTLELIAAGTLQGVLTMSCESPGEACFDLSDNDGDGDVDCSDIDCSRSPSCVEDQEDLETVALDCSEDFIELTPPEIGTLDDQRIVYATFPGGEGAPPHEYWGGAELVINEAEAAGTVEVEVDGPGLACPAQIAGDAVLCDAPVRIDDSQVWTFDTNALLYLEPLGAVWPGVRVRLLCD